MNDYVEDRLSGRRIWWCPGGEGYFAYCPQPTDSDQFNYCCLYYHLGIDRPSCCRFPFHTGVLIAFCLSSIVALLVLLFLMCWFCHICPLAKKMRKRKEAKEEADDGMNE